LFIIEVTDEFFAVVVAVATAKLFIDDDDISPKHSSRSDIRDIDNLDSKIAVKVASGTRCELPSRTGFDDIF
jgi:hypothetical protein